MTDSDELGPVGGPVNTPFSAAVNAMLTFILGLHLHEAAQSSRIVPTTFANPLTLQTNGDKIVITKAYTPDQVKVGVENNLWATLAVSAEAMNRALDDTFGPKQPATFDDLNEARAIVYQIRNCFAHNPFAPTWRVDQRYRRLMRVASVNVQVDGGACHGRAVVPDDSGGWQGYF
jgi:hypothetical protein